MIPAGLSTTRVAFLAWRQSVTPETLADLADDDLGAMYQAVADLARDVEETYCAVREAFVRRMMATRPGPS